MKNVNLTGIFIPIGVLQMTDLSANEKLVLSLIDYYTKNGESKACFLTNQQIAELTGINYYYVRNFIKPSLRKKGLIQSNGVRTVSNLYSEKNDTNTDVHNICTPDVHKKSILSVHKNTTPDVHKICTPDVHKICTQKKEEKKELKNINTGNVDDSTCNKENSTMNSSDFWNSWKRFKDVIGTLTPEEQSKNFQVYWNKLGKLYTGDRLEEHRSKITKEYEYLSTTSNDNNDILLRFTNGDTYHIYKPNNFEPIEKYRMSPLSYRGSLILNFQMISNILGGYEPKLKGYTKAYVAYYFNEIIQHFYKKTNDLELSAELTKSKFNQAKQGFEIQSITIPSHLI